MCGHCNFPLRVNFEAHLFNNRPTFLEFVEKYVAIDDLFNVVVLVTNHTNKHVSENKAADHHKEDLEAGPLLAFVFDRPLVNVSVVAGLPHDAYPLLCTRHFEESRHPLEHSVETRLSVQPHSSAVHTTPHRVERRHLEFFSHFINETFLLANIQVRTITCLEMSFQE